MSKASRRLRYWEFFACAGLSLLTWGCSSVKPGADYRRTAERITERTGAVEVYDPEADSAVREKVARLLEDGLTADEAVRVALLNNAAFQSQFLEIGASRADVVQSGLLANPVLAVSGRMPQGGGRVNLSFSLAQEVVDLWQIPVRKKIARKQLEQTVSKVVRAAVELRAQVKTSYYRLLATERARDVARENRQLVERSLDSAQRRFQAGEATVLDVNLVKASVLEQGMRVISLERDERQARADLARVLGLTRWETGWKLIDSLPTATIGLPEDDALLAQAANERLDLQMAALDEEATEADVARELRSIFPSVVLGVEGERPELRAPRTRPYAPLENTELVKPPGYTPQDAALDLSHQAGNILRQQLGAKRDRAFEKKQSSDLLLGPSLQATVPVWDRNRARIAKARLRVLQKRKDFEDLADSVGDEVVRAAAAVRSAAELVRLSSEEALPQAQANVETAERVYRAGEETILALTTAQESLIRQREAHTMALGDYASALAELERAVGGRLPSSPPSPESTPAEGGNGP